MRVALVFPGDSRSPAVRSGTPLGLAEGLKAHGVDVVHVRAEPDLAPRFIAETVLTAAQLPRALAAERGNAIRRSRAAALCRPELGRMRTRAVRQRLDTIPDVDAVLQVGTGFRAPAGLPLVTHDDMTIVQAVEHGYSQWRTLPRRAIDARIELQRATCDQALACCVESRWAARSLEVDYGISTEKIFVVGVGSNRAAPRYREGKEWAPPRFLFVGSDWERKNGEAVLRAFGELRRSVPDARLDVVGPHPHMDYPGVTPNGVLPLSDRAAQERLDRLFRCATCFVMPSRFEPFGIVFAEASAAGIPSIGTTVGGCRDLLEGCGRVVDPSDHAALLAAMRSLSHPAVAERAGGVARERAKAFTWPSVGARVLRAMSGGLADGVCPEGSLSP